MADATTPQGWREMRSSPRVITGVDYTSQTGNYSYPMARTVQTDSPSHVPRRLLEKSESAVGLGVYAGQAEEALHYESFPRRASISAYSPYSAKSDFSDSEGNSPHFNFSPYPETAASPFTPFLPDEHGSFVTVEHQKLGYASSQKNNHFEEGASLHFEEDTSLHYQEDPCYQPSLYDEKKRYSYPIVTPELPPCPLEITHPVDTRFLPCTLQRRPLGPYERALHGPDATALVPIYNAQTTAQFPFAVNSFKSLASNNPFLSQMNPRSSSQATPATPPSLAQSDSESNISRYERSPSLSLIESQPPPVPPPTAVLPQLPGTFGVPVDLESAAMAASLAKPNAKSELLTRPAQNPLPLPKMRKKTPDQEADLFETRTKYRRNPTEHTMIRPPPLNYQESYSSLESGRQLNLTYPSFPTLPFGSNAHMITEKRSAGEGTQGELTELDNFGRPVCKKGLAQTLLVLFVLFPPLWLLMGTGFLDEPIGVIPTLEKRLALFFGSAFLIIAIASIIVGLTVGL